LFGSAEKILSGRGKKGGDGKARKCWGAQKSGGQKWWGENKGTPRCRNLGFVFVKKKKKGEDGLQGKERKKKKIRSDVWKENGAPRGKKNALPRRGKKKRLCWMRSRGGKPILPT